MSQVQIVEAGQESLKAVDEPWFVTYNRIYCEPSRTKLHSFIPFPDGEFCGHGPWEDHIVVSHFGVETFAKDAGFERVEDYLLSRIASAPKRGGFCASCQSRTCPEKE